MSDVENALPGYTEFELPESEHEDWTTSDWQDEFNLTKDQVARFLAIRDPFIVLARSAIRLITERPEPTDKLIPLEQSSVEIIQALLLFNTAPIKSTPTSPGSFVRFWPLVSRNQTAFLHMQMRSDEDNKAVAFVSQRARLQTLYYRNLFTRSDCEEFVSALLTRVDTASENTLGYRLSELLRAMIRIVVLFEEKLHAFRAQVYNVLTGRSRSEVLEAIDFFRRAYPVAERAWRNKSEKFSDLKGLRDAGFQLSELAYPWVCTFSHQQLEQEFAPHIVQAIDRLCFRPGDLASSDPLHIYLNNPIWQRPYIRRDNGVFVALPNLIFSFPFAIFEGLMVGHGNLLKAYEDARAELLESEVARIVRRSMPSAKVYEGVIWTDPDSGQNFENDVVAFIGNYIFLFEAKSGKIKDAARRGGFLSLEKNFKSLFVEPGIQAWRLQNYVDSHKSKAVLRNRSDGKPLPEDLSNLKVIYKFSVCIEHFASLTSANYYLKELGLIDSDTAWSPVLSLGELMMISRFLDTEVSFVHYLTRRATLEEFVDVEGDEQDYLSIYLTNGLWLDPTVLDGRRLLLHNADSLVRRPKVARSIRTVFELHGVQLSPLWLQIAKELYLDNSQRHRFDIINVILNQFPPALAEVERRIRRWRRGVPHGGEDVAIIRFKIGTRNFILAIRLMKVMASLPEWRNIAHDIAAPFAMETGIADCAVFMMLRKTKHAFDGVSFFRFGKREKPKSVA